MMSTTAPPTSVLNTTSEEHVLTSIGKDDIPCPRCRSLKERAQKLLVKTQSINVDNVFELCNHCRIKGLSKKKFDDAEVTEKNYTTIRDEFKLDMKQQIKIWLSKLKQFFVYDCVKKEKPVDIQLGQLCKAQSSPSNVHEPKIEQMFVSKTYEKATNLSMDGSVSIQEQDVQNKKCTDAFTMTPCGGFLNLLKSDVIMKELLESYEEPLRSAVKSLLASSEGMDRNSVIKKLHDFTLRYIIKSNKGKVSYSSDIKLVIPESKNRKLKDEANLSYKIRKSSKAEIVNTDTQLSNKNIKYQPIISNLKHDKENLLTRLELTENPNTFFFPITKECPITELEVDSLELIRITQEKLLKHAEGQEKRKLIKALEDTKEHLSNRSQRDKPPVNYFDRKEKELKSHEDKHRQDEERKTKKEEKRLKFGDEITVAGKSNIQQEQKHVLGDVNQKRDERIKFTVKDEKKVRAEQGYNAKKTKSITLEHKIILKDKELKGVEGMQARYDEKQRHIEGNPIKDKGEKDRGKDIKKLVKKIESDKKRHELDTRIKSRDELKLREIQEVSSNISIETQRHKSVKRLKSKENINFRYDEKEYQDIVSKIGTETKRHASERKLKSKEKIHSLHDLQKIKSSQIFRKYKDEKEKSLTKPKDEDSIQVKYNRDNDHVVKEMISKTAIIPISHELERRLKSHHKLQTWHGEIKVGHDLDKNIKSKINLDDASEFEFDDDNKKMASKVMKSAEVIKTFDFDDEEKLPRKDEERHGGKIKSKGEESTKGEYSDEVKDMMAKITKAKKKYEVEKKLISKEELSRDEGKTLKRGESKQRHDEERKVNTYDSKKDINSKQRFSVERESTKVFKSLESVDRNIKSRGKRNYEMKHESKIKPNNVNEVQYDNDVKKMASKVMKSADVIKTVNLDDDEKIITSNKMKPKGDESVTKVKYSDADKKIMSAIVVAKKKYEAEKKLKSKKEKHKDEENKLKRGESKQRHHEERKLKTYDSENEIKIKQMSSAESESFDVMRSLKTKINPNDITEVEYDDDVEKKVSKVMKSANKIKTFDLIDDKIIITSKGELKHEGKMKSTGDESVTKVEYRDADKAMMSAIVVAKKKYEAEKKLLKSKEEKRRDEENKLKHGESKQRQQKERKVKTYDSEKDIKSEQRSSAVKKSTEEIRSLESENQFNEIQLKSIVGTKKREIELLEKSKRENAPELEVRKILGRGVEGELFQNSLAKRSLDNDYQIDYIQLKGADGKNSKRDNARGKEQRKIERKGGTEEQEIEEMLNVLPKPSHSDQYVKEQKRIQHDYERKVHAEAKAQQFPDEYSTQKFFKEHKPIYNSGPVTTALPLSEHESIEVMFQRRDIPFFPVTQLELHEIRVRRPSPDDFVLQLMKLRQNTPALTQKPVFDRSLIAVHKEHLKNALTSSSCDLCLTDTKLSKNDSELQLDVESLENQKREVQHQVLQIIVGEKVFNQNKAPLLEESDGQSANLLPYKRKYHLIPTLLSPSKYETETKTEEKPDLLKNIMALMESDTQPAKGIIRYALSDRSFIDKGWTMLPTEKVVRKMNVYRMRPAHPEFDWFENNKNKRLMKYDTGEKLAEFDDNGRGRWYYRNGRVALDYYDAEETNAQQRYVVYSSGEPDDRGRSCPITILATFDYLGNGIVFNHSGKIRLKYNQTEGVVLDREIGPVSHWKWHTLNDPPVLQQVMIDTQLAHKDPVIMELGTDAENKIRTDNEEMLAIEFDNFIKEKSKKLSQKFKPFQIKMKALKINENFSLKVLDQATIYLIFRDGVTNLKLNIGMILDHQEIVDTDTAEVGEVSNSIERLPARTESLARLQQSVAHAQRYERQRTERERRLRPPGPVVSADKLNAAASPPLRPPINTLPTNATSSTGTCKCKKSSKSLYYNTRLI